MILVNSTKNSEDSTVASKMIVQRLIRWSDFLKNKKSDILSEEKIKGLIGELLFMKHVNKNYSMANIVEFWIGPDGAPQDFNINNSAIEVKCQSGGSTPTVTISSENQLVSQLPNLFLYIVTLGKTTSDSPELINLPILISEIKSALALNAKVLHVFEDNLMNLGYYNSDKYFEYNYIVSAEQVFKVQEGFPRICAATLIPGVKKVTYKIELLECSEFEIDINGWEV